MLDIFSRKPFIVFTTRHYAAEASVSLSAASHKLTRLEKDGLLTKVAKGVWANTGHPWFSAEACVPHLLGKEQGYVSFLSVLHSAGLISQIPATLQIATTGHSRTLKSPVAVFEFIQIKPTLMQSGIEWSETHIPFLQATPEKALFDCLYIATRKGKRFVSLPELDFSDAAFDEKQFITLLENKALPENIRIAMRERYG